MRNWGNMSTTAHGTPQSQWRCEENLFEGTGAFSSTVRSRPGPALAHAPGLQLSAALQCTCQEQALRRTPEPRAGATENPSCLWAALGGEAAGTFLTPGAGGLAVFFST